MNIELFKILGQIAGIGGIAFGTLLIIFREIVRKKIFPNLTKEQGYKLFRLIIVLVFMVAIAGISSWTYIEKISDSNNDKKNRTGQNHSSYSIVSYEDTVDFSSWVKFKDKVQKTSPVHRSVQITVVKNDNSREDYLDRMGTSGPAIDCQILSSNATWFEIIPSPMPPRKVYKLQAPFDFFEPNVETEISYKTTYWNCFSLNLPKGECKDCDVSKRFPYTVDNYTLTIIFPQNLKYKSITMVMTLPDANDSEHKIDFYNKSDSDRFIWKNDKPIPGGTLLVFWIELDLTKSEML